MAGRPPSPRVSGVAGQGPARRRGRPPIVVTEEVLERRRLSRQRIRAQALEGVDGQGPAPKRGRPPVVVTAEVQDRRRLSRQRVNAQRRKEEGPSRGRGRPRGSMNKSNPDQKSLAMSPSVGIPAQAEAVAHAHESGGTTHGAAIADNLQSPPAKESESRGESQRMRRSIDGKKKEFMESNVVLSLGKQDQTCGFCTAQVWSAEFTGRHVGSGPKGYTICCGKGKVQLPLLREPPHELAGLINFTAHGSLGFFARSRVYNNMFAFCSFGGNVDNSVNNGRGPYVFRVNGRTYHSLGSLVPPDGLTPKFAQLYMYDGQDAVAHRLNFSGKTGDVDPAIVSVLQEMLDRDNVLVGMFKQMRDRFTNVEPEPVCLRLLERRTTDGRIENVPTVNDYEFAALVVDNNFVNCRDVVAEHKQRGLQHISDLHPSYMSLQYPLLFPFGEDGYRTKIKHRNRDDSGGENGNTVSMREYYAFRAHYRVGEGHTLILGGRLFLQYIVDAWCSVERSRLLWVEKHQSVIRSDLYNNIVDSVRRGDVEATDVGKRVILPSSFTGGYRYMQQNFQDSLAVCKEYGHPDLFITFTCNPKWDEIQESVNSSGSRDASVRPDLVARVFKMKLDSMVNDLTKKNVLGRVLAVVYTVEFQKRGLPHAHIVLWLAAADKLLTTEDIDNVISAEIPDKETDPVGYKAVSQFMMHGPCGAANPKCPCMSNGQCTKHFPKHFSDATVVDEDGYALYRRRNVKTTVECNGIHLDNRCRFNIPGIPSRQ